MFDIDVFKDIKEVSYECYEDTLKTMYPNYNTAYKPTYKGFKFFIQEDLKFLFYLNEQENTVFIKAPTFSNIADIDTYCLYFYNNYISFMCECIVQKKYKINEDIKLDAVLLLVFSKLVKYSNNVYIQDLLLTILTLTDIVTKPLLAMYSSKNLHYKVFQVDEKSIRVVLNRDEDNKVYLSPLTELDSYVNHKSFFYKLDFIKV